MSKAVTIVHLYPHEMNIYGDSGNLIVLKKRLEWRSIPYEVVSIAPGENIPSHADIILGGGGQDASQSIVAKDLLKKKTSLHTLTEDNCVMLLVCGMYQLFGRRFVTHEGAEINGLGILPLETHAGEGRIIGNIHVHVEGLPPLIGYENHSGRTYLDTTALPLGKVLLGKGNDDSSGQEGCRYKNIFGTYMHGPILSKNPEFADLLIDLALEKTGIKSNTSIDDTLTHKAREIALKRPR